MSLEQQLSDAIAAQNALPQAVAGKQAAIDASVAGKIADMENWKTAARNEFAFPFSRTIVVQGDASKYYPVVVPYAGETLIYDLFVGRYHGAQCPPSLGADHVAGLSLRMKFTGNAWAAYYMASIEDYRFAYHTAVARVQMKLPGLVLWLRGGGMAYQLAASGDFLRSVDMYGTPAWTPQIADAGTLFPNAPPGGSVAFTSGSMPFRVELDLGSYGG